MPSHEIIDVQQFMEKFNIDQPFPTKPTVLPGHPICRRINHIEEEMEELRQAVVAQDLPAIADALVDLVYVIKGTALAMQLPWDMLWADVQRANMTKEYDPTAAKIAVKPKDWQGPQTQLILELMGWRPDDLKRSVVATATKGVQLELAPRTPVQP